MKWVLTICFAASVLIGLAQKIPVGSPVALEYLRRSQLQIQDSSNLLFFPSYDSSSVVFKALEIQTGLQGLSVSFLPVNLRMEYAHHHPYATGNQAMLWAAGFQSVYSAGITIKHKFISAQIRPDLLQAGNPAYEGFPDKGERGRDRYIWWYQSDSPERLLDNNHVRLLPGQSFLKFHAGNLSSGISTENRIWGPGIYNNLLLSDNARGFSHFFIQSEMPLQTRIGTIHWEVISGLLKGSNNPSGNTDDIWRFTPLYQPLRNESRYFNGFHLVYHPKWINGLFIGFNGTTQQYLSQVGFEDILGSITDRFRPVRYLNDFDKIDRYGSVFSRWVWTNAEIYFEVGKHGRNSLRNIILEPQRRSAFVVGLQKIFPINTKSQAIAYNMEFTQLGQQLPSSIRNAESWYISPKVNHGYTHEGQWLGAGIGPGSNQQTFEVSFVSGPNKLGLLAERRHNNSDYYYYVSESIRDWRRYWIDYSIGLVASFSNHRFSMDANTRYVYSMNYQWELDEDPNIYVIPGRDVGQWTAMLNIAYKFSDISRSKDPK